MGVGPVAVPPTIRSCYRSGKPSLHHNPTRRATLTCVSFCSALFALAPLGTLASLRRPAVLQPTPTHLAPLSSGNILANLSPSGSLVAVVEEALKAARRVNDYSTAVRIFEGLKEKTENAAQYAQYVAETAPLRQELGVLLKEELYSA